MNKKKVSLHSILLMFIFPGVVLAQQNLDKDWIAQRMTWQGTIQKGTPVEIHNPFGDVRLRGTDQQVVDVTAHTQMKKGDEHQVTFKSQMKDGILKIVVSYAGKEEDTVKMNGKRRLDMAVFIPEGSHLTVRTHKGQIQAKGLNCDVDLYSDRGNITSSNKGHVVIGSRQGNITAALRQVAWDKPATIESLLGIIEVQLPRKTSLAIQATTSGKITTDYSIQIKRTPNSKEKVATTILGEGKNRLVIKNNSGAIQILEGSWRVD